MTTDLTASTHKQAQAHTRVNNEPFAPKGVGDVFRDQLKAALLDNSLTIASVSLCVCVCACVCACVHMRWFIASTEALWCTRCDRAIFPGSPQHDGPHQGATEKVWSLFHCFSSSLAVSNHNLKSTFLTFFWTGVLNIVSQSQEGVRKTKQISCFKIKRTSLKSTSAVSSYFSVHWCTVEMVTL